MMLKTGRPREQLLFRSSAIFDDQDRAFKKSNGEWTYFANDAAYHLDKYNRRFDKLINIWGRRSCWIYSTHEICIKNNFK